MSTASEMKRGGRYNWKGQPERLIYLGRNWSGNGYWHQFEKVGEPGFVWCEVVDADLASFEESKPKQAGGEDQQVVMRVARVLADRSAAACNVDAEDNWKIYSETYVEDARAVVSALFPGGMPTAADPVAWRATSVGIKQFVTDSWYQRARPQIKRWYEPFSCANCRVIRSAEASPPPPIGSAPRAGLPVGTYEALNPKFVP